ncbi:MAG TPA: hypothetical protein VLW46_00625 [Candidatus Bathyarchaeia archaeon]|nr:hypothetical protein [Candidatus Bathyarchaeia archaeon]
MFSGPSFETLKASILAPAYFAPKLTLFEPQQTCAIVWGVSVEDRLTLLKSALEDQRLKSERRAALLDYISLGLAVIALGCTVAAAVLGIFTSVPSKIVGGIAGLPAVIGSVALALKVDVKASWHYRKAVKTRALLRRLCFEGPEPMTTEYITSISAEFNRLDETMAEERPRTSDVFNPPRSV